MAPLRAHWEAKGSGDFSPLWSGQNASGCREVPAADITRSLIELASGLAHDSVALRVEPALEPARQGSPAPARGRAPAAPGRAPSVAASDRSGAATSVLAFGDRRLRAGRIHRPAHPADAARSRSSAATWALSKSVSEARRSSDSCCTAGRDRPVRRGLWICNKRHQIALFIGGVRLAHERGLVKAHLRIGLAIGVQGAGKLAKQPAQQSVGIHAARSGAAAAPGFLRSRRACAASRRSCLDAPSCARRNRSIPCAQQLFGAQVLALRRPAAHPARPPAAARKCIRRVLLESAPALRGLWRSCSSRIASLSGPLRPDLAPAGVRSDKAARAPHRPGTRLSSACLAGVGPAPGRASAGLGPVAGAAAPPRCGVPGGAAGASASISASWLLSLSIRVSCRL